MRRSARVHGLRLARVGLVVLATITTLGVAPTAGAFGPVVPPPPPADAAAPAAPAPSAPMFGVAPGKASPMKPVPAKNAPAPAVTATPAPAPAPTPRPPAAPAGMKQAPAGQAPLAPTNAKPRAALSPGAAMSASPARPATPAAPRPAVVRGPPPGAAPAPVAPAAAAAPVRVAAPGAASVPSPRGAGAPAAAGAPRPSLGTANLADARLHFQQGVALYQDQNYDAALAEFQGAYAISGEPVVLYNMGLTYKALFRYAEAIDTLERYLSESAARSLTVTKERRAEVERLAAEMKSLLADVSVVVKPAAATVRIDGRSVALGIEGIVKLATGSHVIEATAANHLAERRQITVVAGTPQTVSLVLAEVPRSGRVKIAATQIGARVLVDGRDQGPSPVEIELPVGGHQVEVLAPGYAPNRSELAIAAGQTRTVTIVLEAPREESGPVYKKWWFWAGVGAVVVAGAAFALAPDSTQGPLPGTLGTSSTTISQ